MDNKLKGVLIGVAGVILWFMPFAAWEQEFMGQNMMMNQSGQHIGGIAYLLLLAAGGYAYWSWVQQHQLRIVAAAVMLGVSVLFAVRAGTSTAWGLIGLLLVAGGGLWLAWRDGQGSQKPKGANDNQTKSS